MVDNTSTRLQLITPGGFPDYRKTVAPLAEACWPEFMLHDPVADEHWGALFERFADYQFGFLDTETGKAAAMGNSVPLFWNHPVSDLPEEGWDWAMGQAVNNHRTGITPNLHCAIQIAIDPAYRGHGLSTRMVHEMRGIGMSKGFKTLVAPVRPSQKATYPLSDIDRYIEWKSEDNLPFDAWLRVHARLGAMIVKACHKSMTIRGTLDEWHSWTGLAFPESGAYAVPGALNPVEIDLAMDCGVYVEPNVWMTHELN